VTESTEKVAGKIKGYRVYPAIVVPLTLAVSAIAVAVAHTPWAYLALPFIYLGSVCAAPNFNLANGFLAFVAVLAGCCVMHFDAEAGAAIVIGAGASWMLSSIEKLIKARPITDNTESSN
jgi:hypothetical protein